MVADQPALSVASQGSEDSLEDHGVLVIHLLLAGKIDGFTFTKKNVFLAMCDKYPTAGTVLSSVPEGHKMFGSSYLRECNTIS